MPISIFICYARRDEALLNELKTHLKPLQRDGLINLWYDHDISAGTEWEPQIMRHLNAAQIVLLLVSPDFMNSDYCYGIEMNRALKRHERGEARVIPIILRPVYWHGKLLGKLQALPTDGKPVTSSFWQDRDAAFYDITQGLCQVVKQLMPAPLPVFGLAVLRTLTNHASPVIDVAISADGCTLVSGCKDGKIKVWKFPNGKKGRTLTGHAGPVLRVAISADGRTLVSGSKDCTIKVWDLSRGKEVCTFTSHTNPVECVAISADGQTLVSGGSGKTIKVWDLPKGEELRTLAGHTDTVTSVVISADGQTLVSVSGDKTIKVWNLSKGELVRTLTGHTDCVTSVAISADGQRLFSGSKDHTIKVWDLSKGELVRTLTGHTDCVTSVAISADGQRLFSGSEDCTIKVWGA
jgi:WD40 repeat protein